MEAASSFNKYDLIQIFREDIRLHACDISIELRGNTLIIDGRVPDYEALRATLENAWSTPGVHFVYNRIIISQNQSIMKMHNRM